MAGVRDVKGREGKRGKRRTVENGNVESTAFHDDVEEEEGLTLSDHKKQLAELATKDPQFYKFLKEQEADLLQFDESESESETEEGEEGYDETCSEVRRDSTGREVIDRDFLTKLQTSLLEKDRPDPAIVHQVVAAFRACVSRVGANIEPPNYVINDGDVFESVVRLCFTHLSKSLYSLLGPVNTEADDEGVDSKLTQVGKHKRQYFRHWKKHSSLVKSYLQALLQFLNEVQTSSVVVCALRAIIDLLELYNNFPKLTRNVTKAMIRIWSRRTDECRCAAFMALCKLVRINKSSFPAVIKWCYLGYVTNVRDVNAQSWPLIVFMQKSFAELCMIRPEIAYQYTFVYIRQTAIHLRNAMIAKRKDLIQTVYNWQFIQCLYLWARVVSKACRHRIPTKNDDAAGIEELAYPLCQIVTSTMKLFPSLKYFPLRLHCLRILLIVQQNCQIYIATLPLAVELLRDVLLILKKKPVKGKVTFKGIDVKCMLKTSAAHLEDAGFRQAALEELFRIHLESAHIVQQSCAFPDLVIPVSHEIKAFVKNCRNTEFARLFKSLETKLKEQAVYARRILNNTDMDLTNEALLRHLERQFRALDAPLTKFYDSWQRIWKLREGAVNPVDTKPAQQLAPSDIGTTPSSITETKPVVRKKAPEIKKSKPKQTMNKDEKSISLDENKEDILEDLVLSDIED